VRHSRFGAPRQLGVNRVGFGPTRLRSACAPIAAVTTDIRLGRDVPTATSHALFNDLIGKLLELRWHINAECLGGLEVDH
jgi:hypothetical protein